MEKEEKAHVQIFGEDLPHRHRHFSSGRVVWGVVFIFAGIILLLNSLNLIPWFIWDFIWPFWPSLLILWGIHILLGDNLVSDFVMLILSLAVVGMIVLYALNQTGSPLVNLLPADITRFISLIKPLSQ